MEAFGLVVIDEVHRLRNAGTVQASAIQELQAEDVVGINGTIDCNQSSKLTRILSLAPGQEARWKSYIRTGQRNPFDCTGPESLSARLTVGAFERYIIGNRLPIPLPLPLLPLPLLPLLPLLLPSLQPLGSTHEVFRRMQSEIRDYPPDREIASR